MKETKGIMTKITRIGTGGHTFKTTIPKLIAEQMDIDEYCVAVWTIYVNDEGELKLKVDFMRLGGT